MKRTLALLMVVGLILALFAGCGQAPDNGGTTTTTPTPPTTQKPADTGNDSGSSGTDAQPEETPDEGDKLPFAVDERGIATESYNWPLPLTEDDTTLTYWFTIWTPEYLGEGGYGETALPVEAEKRTGVHVEYVAATSAARNEAFSVMLAADDLCDVVCNAHSFFPGTPVEMVEDGYFVNIYDYRHLMPNYMYETTYRYPDDIDTHSTVFYYEDFVPVIYGLNVVSGEALGGFCFRQDWLDDIGLDADDMVTWDDYHEYLTATKVAVESCEYPLWLNQTLEMAKYWQWQAFGSMTAIPTTAMPSVYLKEGKIQLGCTTEEDLNLMKQLNSWYNEGLINPDWSAYPLPKDFTEQSHQGLVACMYQGGTGLGDADKLSMDPDCNWKPIQKPLLYEDQVFTVGASKTRTATASASIAAKNNNLELALKWLDYRYSPDGWELYAYGPEGVIVYTDENGNRRNTEFALNNPNGQTLSWLVFIYSINCFCDPGIQTTETKLLNESGDKCVAAINSWSQWLTEHYDASGLLPAGVRLTSEQSEELGEYRNEVVTFIAENFSMYLDGSKPFSEWDAYVEQLNQIGLEEIKAIYQEAYDEFAARTA